MSNEEIVSRIQNGEDLQTELYQQNTGMIEWMAKRYKGLSPLDDLRQEAAIALMEAAMTYKPDSGIVFSTYAINSMRWAIYRYIQNTASVIRIPAGTQGEARNNDPAADTALLRQARRAAAVDSLDRELDGMDGKVLSDTIQGAPDFSGGLIDKMVSGQAAAELWKEVDALDGLQGKVIRMKYQQGKTIEQMAEVMRTDSGTVRSARDKAMRSLRVNRKIRKIGEDLGLIESIAYHGTLARFKRTFTSSTEEAAERLIALREQARIDFEEAERMS